MSLDIVSLTCEAVTVLAIGLYFAMMPAQRRKQARDREYRCLQHEPVTFPGRVYGCAKWRRCSMRIIATPPYGEDAPADACPDHGLRMDTRIVERRVISHDAHA